jgi:hypothetical protein
MFPLLALCSEADGEVSNAELFHRDSRLRELEALGGFHPRFDVTEPVPAIDGPPGRLSSREELAHRVIRVAVSERPLDAHLLVRHRRELERDARLR